MIKNQKWLFKRYKLGWGTLLDDHVWIDNTNLQWVAKDKDREEILKDESIEWAVGFDLSLQGMDATSWVLAGWLPLSDDESPLNDQRLYIYGKIYYGNIQKKQSLIKEKHYLLAQRRLSYISKFGSYKSKSSAS